MVISASVLHHLVLAFHQGASMGEFDPWTYFLLALLVMIEGPIAILAGSVAASAGLMQPGLVFLAAAVGNLTSDSLWWLLGYAGKPEWIHSVGRRLRIRESQIEHLKQSMVKDAVRVMVFCKMTHALSIPALIAGGLLRVPWKRWFPWYVPVEVLWTGCLVLAGYYTTHAISRLAEGMEFVVLGASVLCIAVMLYWGRRALRQLEMQESGAETR